MEIKNKAIDGGRPFDWGKASADYAKYRDIYPPIFYRKIADRKLCVSGQTVLDLGTGTGVLPRNMYCFGARWYGADISENQIAQADMLSRRMNMKIQYQTAAAEDVDFPDQTFDVITACQCFWYFDHEKVVPRLSAMLKKNGRLLLLYMAWLPFEDQIAGASERLGLSVGRSTPWMVPVRIRPVFCDSSKSRRSFFALSASVSTVGRSSMDTTGLDLAEALLFRGLGVSSTPSPTSL